MMWHHGWGMTALGILSGALAVIIAVLIITVLVLMIVRLSRGPRAFGPGFRPWRHGFTPPFPGGPGGPDSPGAAESAANAAPRTLEQRLAEIDDLHARGVITDDERATARAAILAT